MNIPYYDLPVFIRIAIAICCLILIMLAEKLIKKDKAYRWKGYGLWLAMAGLGLVFGFLLDLLTIHISPEYFRIGKGVAIDNIWLTCLNVGGAAGFLAAALMGGAVLIKNKLLVVQSLKIPWHILASTKIIFVLAFVGILAAYALPPLLPRDEIFVARLTAEQIEPFFKVQQIHAGSYLGALLGFLIMLFRKDSSGADLAPATLRV